MWIYLAKSPRWVNIVILGGTYAVGSVLVLAILVDLDWQTALVYMVVGGPLYGVSSGVTLSRIYRERLAVAGDLSSDRLRAANRACLRGPAPSDPKVRRSALALAGHRYGESRKNRMALITVVSFALVAFAAIALFDRPLAWLVFALTAGSLAVALVWPSYLRRRVALLADGYAA
jgi:hypothetical protein